MDSVETIRDHEKPVTTRIAKLPTSGGSARKPTFWTGKVMLLVAAVVIVVLLSGVFFLLGRLGGATALPNVNVAASPSPAAATPSPSPTPSPLPSPKKEGNGNSQKLGPNKVENKNQNKGVKGVKRLFRKIF
jgi:hypothetical protein